MQTKYEDLSQGFGVRKLMYTMLSDSLRHVGGGMERGISKEFAIIRAQTQIGKTFFLLRSFFFSWSVVAHGVVIHLFFPPKKIDHRVIRKVTRLEPDNSNTWDTRWVDVMYVRVIHKVT
jgi:hypothetical protein